MSKPLKKYTKAEKLEIIKESLEDEVTVPQLAQRYGVAANTIYNWRTRYRKEMGIEAQGQGVRILSDEQRQILRLEREVREARLERDILKKAIGIFSKSDGKSTGL